MQSSGILARLWDTLHSMKFAVWILVLTAALSLFALFLGEFLPQNAQANPLFRLTGLADPFRSWWFRILLGVLSLSLLVCVIERATLQTRLAFRRTFRLKPVQFVGMPNYYKGMVEVPADKINSAMQKLGVAVRTQQGEDWAAWSGVSGGLSRLGPLLTHIGMFLLILGGLAGSLTHVGTRVSGSAGDVITQPEWDFSVRVDSFHIVYYPVGLNLWVETPDGKRGKVTQLKGDSASVLFTVHAGHEELAWYPKSKLRTEFYILDGGRRTPFSGNIRSYISDVTVIEDAREVATRRIEVNHPLRWGGYRFYQSSFQPGMARTVVDTVVVTCRHAEFGTADVRLKIGERQKLPWGGFEISTEQFLPDFRLDENMRPFAASGELRNPAVRARLFKDGEELGAQWLFMAKVGHMGGGSVPVDLSLTDLAGIRTIPAGYTTILEVNRESGRWLIWLGFIAMTLGLLLAYMTNHRQVWALVVKNMDGKTELHFAGSSHREESHFRARMETAAQSLGVVKVKQ